MREHSVLKQLQNGDINAFQAYLLLERGKNRLERPQKAHFVKMSVSPEEESRKVKVLLSFLFALPLPLFIARWALDRGLKGKIDQDSGDAIDIEAFKNLLKYAKGTTIDVISKDASVNVKIL